MITERERRMFEDTAQDDVSVSRFTTHERGKNSGSSYDEQTQKDRMRWAKSKLAGSVLDIGTGVGYLINDYGGPAVGIDGQPSVANEAKRTNRHPAHEFYCVNARMGLPFADASFDVVCLCELLEHLRFSTSVYVLKEALRCARQYCITTFPYMHEGDYCMANVESYDHMWCCTKELIERLVVSAGGKIESFEELSNRQFACLVIRKA